MPFRSRVPLLLGLLAAFTGGCDGCGRRAERRTDPGAGDERARHEVARERGCTTAEECEDRDPCTKHDCVDERCEVSLVPRGTPCDDDTVCNGVALCDANGRCVPGAPPAIDDGNPCTIDTCDPVRGARHEPVPIDDFDACTLDACDGATGSITHATVAVDDGNDCTLDSCDPRTGVKHEQPQGTYTCQSLCEPGFHVASRARSSECGSPEALRSYCAPNCGPSFHTCDVGCPKGYVRRGVRQGGTCGTNPPLMAFCVKG
jgi:hypothetical protein